MKSFAYVCKKTSRVTTSCYHVAAQRVGAAVSTKPNRGQSGPNDLTTSRAPSVNSLEDRSNVF